MYSHKLIVTLSEKIKAVLQDSSRHDKTVPSLKKCRIATEQGRQRVPEPGTRKILVQSLVTLSDLGIMGMWKLNPTDLISKLLLKSWVCAFLVQESQGVQ